MLEFMVGHGFGVVVALQAVHAELAQFGGSSFVFYPFCHGFEVEGARQVDDGLGPPARALRWGNGG